jgi:hypothetical protein
VAIFAIDEPTIRRSAVDGASAGDLLHLLEEQATHGVPSTVVRAINDWTRVKGNARIGVGTLLLVELPIEELRRILGSKVELHAIRDQVFFVPDGRPEEIVKALRKGNVSCVAWPEPTVPDDGSQAEEEEEEDDTFDEFESGPWTEERSSVQRSTDDMSSEAERFRSEWRRLMRLPGG